MNRQKLHDILSQVAPVSQLSNRSGVIKKDTLILRKKPSIASLNSAVGTNVYWEVMCYVPENSTVALDTLVDKVITALRKNGVDVTNSFGEDYHDEELKAYMSTVEIRTPKVIL